MGHAKALLLVDDEQAELLEHHVLREQPVRADDDVDLARRNAREDLLGFLFRAEAADHVDVDREAGEPLAERLQMLKGQHGRWREKRDLPCRPSPP